MLIYLNREEILNAVVAHLGSTIGVGTSEVALGFINGDVTAVVGVNETLPDDLFEEGDHIEDDNDDTNEQQDTQTTEKPAKQVKRRKRRTRAEIEADEAAAKQAAETQQPQQASGEAAGESQDAQQPETKAPETEAVLETKPEAGADQTQTVEAPTEEAKSADPVQQAESADDNLFAPTHTETAGSVADTKPVDEEVEPAGATGNPFGGDAHAEEDNLFAPTGTQETKPVTETEGGFAKPREDDDALNLFS